MLLEGVAELELALLEFSTTETQAAKFSALSALNKIINPPPSVSHSLEQSVARAQQAPQAHQRLAALMLIRTLSVSGIVDDAANRSQLERGIVALIEKATPDIARELRLSDKRQTFEKYHLIEQAHELIIRPFAVFNSATASLESFQTIRPKIMGAANRDIIKSYLQYHGIGKLQATIGNFYTLLDQIPGAEGYRLLGVLAKLSTFVDGAIDELSTQPTFLTKNYANNFFGKAKELCSLLDREATEHSVARIVPARDPERITDKRYPLHEPDRVIRVSLPFINEGPGVAIDVTAQIAIGDARVITNEVPIQLCDITPGKFVVSFEILIAEKNSGFDVMLELTWREAVNTEKKSVELVVPISAQASTVDWESLSAMEPYSLEIAEGEEFVGRQEKLRSLVGRVRRERMISSYITGQKRIGKSSLALAVKEMVAKDDAAANMTFVYLERGDYAHEDPRVTLKLLGERLAECLVDPDVELTGLNFEGTLAPLNKLADKLYANNPLRKYIFILDEFDGIHPELYRSGALAETFFANLRTLSAKKNIGFILVGGENMPHIISAQGDELNKFARESLTYFSRAEEWSDFCELVERPVRGQIQWHTEALNALFAVTNGHPYYTKQICAEIFKRALADRDADITAEEVARGISKAVSALDTNSFAHLWKDGVGGGREEAEVVAARRSRVLIAIGRVMRKGLPLTYENIVAEKSFMKIQDAEIWHELQDFCQRAILAEEGGRYSFVLPFFGEWIKQSGVNSLVIDHSSEDLEVSLKQREDEAYVKDSEIIELIQKWPTYRGREISSAAVRSWLEQVESRVEQRLLFKILKAVKLYSRQEVSEMLRTSYRTVQRSLPQYTQRARAERRSDVLITYVDGPAKSGAAYASWYAEENRISANCVKEMREFAKALQEHEEKANVSVHGIVIVDDIIGTGKSLSANLSSFVSENYRILEVRNPFISVIAVCGTTDGQIKVRDILKQLPYKNIDLITCDPMLAKCSAFGGGTGIWDSQDEYEEAKALCRRLGSKLVSKAPLGFGDQGLLIVLPDNCPNNSLPILHASGASWTPLFPRAVN